MRTLGNQAAGVGELALPLNKDLFFSAWGRGPENSPAILDLRLLGTLESCEGKRKNKALSAFASWRPWDSLCQGEIQKSETEAGRDGGGTLKMRVT